MKYTTKVWLGHPRSLKTSKCRWEDHFKMDLRDNDYEGVD